MYFVAVTPLVLQKELHKHSDVSRVLCAPQLITKTATRSSHEECVSSLGIQDVISRVERGMICSLIGDANHHQPCAVNSAQRALHV
jgi:hypothetical protein